MPHNKFLKRKAAEDVEFSKFSTDWTDPHPAPDFSLQRPTKIRRTTRAIGRSDVPAAPPTSPISAIHTTTTVENGAPEWVESVEGNDSFRPTLRQRGFISENPALEAIYRRNGKLRKDYADVVKPLRAALAEMAERASRRIKENEKWHMEGENEASYLELIAELEARRDAKIRVIEAKRDLEKAQLARNLEYEKEATEWGYKRKAEQIREAALDRVADDFNAWDGDVEVEGAQ